MHYGSSDLAHRPVAVVDAHYATDSANAAGLVARQWSDPAACEERIVVLPPAPPYRPGAFFERELPCLVAVLSMLMTPFATVVIDGYVFLDGQERPGLGARLYAHFGGRFAVVGVAKKPYRSCHSAIAIERGQSRRPLFVTAVGLQTADAVCLVQGMHGPHRLPTLIARVDQLARKASNCRS